MCSVLSIGLAVLAGGVGILLGVVAGVFLWAILKD